ncbi:MAG TPA: EAL domain-containing response regulator [Microvirga sp.]|jgi:EAL domain-containing protein (putative c-di-GMP-specific phosphodiesterase class I)/CheY-like chemotaxis protein|nr:EAL domain-containing response regulator [Microvirga sp.]
MAWVITVFILDDEAAIRQLIRAAVPQERFEVSEFADVGSAASALQDKSPDLIFLDLELGSGDAIEAFRAFADQGFRGTVQLMSGRGEAVLNTVKSVGDRYGFRLLPPIAKPFRIKQIRSALEEVSAPAAPGEADVIAGRAHKPVSAPGFTLDEALDRGWLELWYQPKLDLGTNHMIGAEGLIRARHPERGVVGPIAFLPDANDEALARLTEFVILTSLRDWEGFQAAGWPLQLCVNVPSNALLSVPIAQLVRQNRPRDEAFPGLVLEITEDQALRSIPLAQEIAAQLRIYDVELSLDDFGQGHSSLARLRDLPFASLKIDRSFVMGCAVDSVKRDLCRTIVDMAHRFGCAVVAEGIETHADLEALRELGCEQGQGYLLGRPMPKDDLIRRLAGEMPPAAKAVAMTALSRREPDFGDRGWAQKIA